jgi:hypothetical protein
VKDKDEPLTEKKDEKKEENVVPEIKKAKEFYHDEEDCDSDLDDLSPGEKKKELFKRL